MKKLIVILLFLTIGCEQPTEFVDVIQEVIVYEYIDNEIIVVEYVDVEKEIVIIETEYVDREIEIEKIIEVEIEKEVIITKYVEVDNIIEIITEVEVETIVIEERITEVYIDVPVEVVTIEYVDRIETVTEYVDRVETVIEYVEVDNIIEIPVETVVTEYVDRIETVIEYVDRVETVTEYIEITEYIDVEVPVEVIVTEYIDRIETVTEYVDRVETVTEFVEVDNIVYNETIIYVEKEVYIMADEIILPDPIQEYQNYITLDNKVKGVIENGFEEIPLIKDLFKIDDTIYFTIDDKFYSQVNGTITGIETLPEIPRSEHVEFVSEPFKIQNADYNGEPISEAFNGTSKQGHYIIDGACLRGSDLIYSAPIDTGGRLKGIYLWTVNNNLSLIMGDGRIW